MAFQKFCLKDIGTKIVLNFFVFVCYSIAISFHLNQEGLNLLEHDIVPVHKASTLMTWFIKDVVKELECSDSWS